MSGNPSDGNLKRCRGGSRTVPILRENGHGETGMGNLICTKCSKRFPLEEKIWRCTCGGLLDIAFQAHFPMDKIRQRKPTMWRYREAIPLFEDKNMISFDEGFTPLIPINFGAKTVWVKQDHLFPTGSYKDRGASVLVSKMR